jgi:hypothetical protein
MSRCLVAMIQKFGVFNFPLNYSVIIITVQIFTLQMKRTAKHLGEKFWV